MNARLVLIVLMSVSSTLHGGMSVAAETHDRQQTDDAWWTGPILAASPATLPQGHWLVEPYFYDSISYGRYDADGERDNVPDSHFFGSQTYVLYGLADRVSVGMIPRFGYLDVSEGRDSSGIRIGDLTFQAQYKLTDFDPSRRTPTTAVVAQVTVPTGKHDELGDRPADGLGSGAYSATLALYSQYLFWMPNGRILRTRLNISQTFSDVADVSDVSVYGTGEGFRGHAAPGDSFSIVAAGEYSITRNWVFAIDLAYERSASTGLQGTVLERLNGIEQRTVVSERFPSRWRFGLSPAIEYNFTSRVGVIVGALWYPVGRNADATITPVVAVNMVY